MWSLHGDLPDGRNRDSWKRTFSEVFVRFTEKDSNLKYEPFLALLQRRRSIREFTDHDIEPRVVEQILEAARSAPMGLPPSDVNVLIINGKEKQEPLPLILLSI